MTSYGYDRIQSLGTPPKVARNLMFSLAEQLDPRGHSKRDHNSVMVRAARTK